MPNFASVASMKKFAAETLKVHFCDICVPSRKVGGVSIEVGGGEVPNYSVSLRESVRNRMRHCAAALAVYLCFMLLKEVRRQRGNNSTYSMSCCMDHGPHPLCFMGHTLHIA